MRSVRVLVVICALIVGPSARPADAKATEKTTSTKLAFALWTTRQDLAPNVFQITNWYIEMAAGTDGTNSKLFYERFVCEDATGQLPCVVAENRDGPSRAKGRRFAVSADLRRGSLDATFDLQSIYPPGVPVGERHAVRVIASWRAIDAPERAHGVSSYDGKCAYRQDVRETGVRARATGTIDGEPLGKTDEARLVSSTVYERRVEC